VTARRPVVGYLVAGLGVLLLVAELPFALASGLVAPPWAVVLLVLLWCVLFVAAIRWFRRHPGRVLLLPVLGAVVWFGALTFGEQVLGWTA
jgi:hypothetical protein